MLKKTITGADLMAWLYRLEPLLLKLIPIVKVLKKDSKKTLGVTL